MSEFISVAFGVICVVIGVYFLEGSDVKNSIRDIGLGLLASAIINTAVRAWGSRQYIGIWLQCFWKPTKPIRISMAYLFRIEVDGQFMLVRNHKNPARGYQPVGGVYKYLKGETSTFFKSLGIYVDVDMPIDVDSRNDLRCRMHHRRNLPEFLKWFESKQDREIDPWREFYEELIVENLLKQHDFPYIQYNYCKTNYEGIKDPEAFSVDEFLYADIVELKPENERQRSEIRRLFNEHGQQDYYMFATPDEIRAGRTNRGQIILPHAKKLLC